MTKVDAKDYRIVAVFRDGSRKERIVKGKTEAKRRYKDMLKFVVKCGGFVDAYEVNGERMAW